MPMKVTVCFDRVRVIVPCGDGDIPVQDLISKAVIRYKKAIGKSADHWVTVHNIKTSNDGGILDPDDLLSDVVDDREQLIAEYDEQGGHSYQPHNGDGASASSAGTASPDIFTNTEKPPYPDSKDVHGYQADGTHDIVVTPKDLAFGSGLTVRHGSEPTLHLLDDNSKLQENKPLQVKEKDEQKPIGIVHAKQASMDDGKNPFSRLARDGWRQSLGSRPDMYKWLEAQERQQEKYKQMERREPLGGISLDQNKENFPLKPPLVKPLNTTDKNKEQGTSKPPPIKQPLLPSGTIPLVLTNDGGPLGIHVVPDYADDKEIGLLVQGVEPEGKVDKDGRLQVNDRIVEINGISLLGVNFSRAQEIFRSAMKNREIKLHVVKRKLPPLPKNPPPTLPKPKGHTPMKPSPLTLSPTKINSSGPISPLNPDQTSTPAGSVPSGSPKDLNISSQSLPSPDNQPIKPGPPIRPGSPIKKVPPAPPARNPGTSLTDNQQKSILAPTNTKKIGKKITIELIKGQLGLGFSVTTRDNPAGGDSPIYIKNILPTGAAIEDGRLKAGDRLLEVNGVNMMNKSQAEAVAELRNCQPNSKVTIVVSRQEVTEDKFKVPRELNSDKANVLQPTEKSGDDDGTLATTMRNKEIIELDIPLNDSGSAGLGVSVKGKTQTTELGQRDLGIFIKAVIHGGAASKDGRLLINDQLLEVNGYTLRGLSNTESMETLRKAMQFDGPNTGCIHLVIARRIGAPSPSPYQEYSTDYSLFNQSDELHNNQENIRENAIDVTNKKDSNVVSKHDMTDGAKAKNYFLLDKLTAGGNGLRNDSYTRATHDSFNDSANMYTSGLSPFVKKPIVRDDSVIIEDDNLKNKKPLRPHSTLGFRMGSLPHSDSSSSEDLNQQPPWLQGQDWNRHASTTSEELSPLPVDAFTRDAVGRQSMSEKRRGHLDPRGTEMYQRAKNIRDSQRGQQGVNKLTRVGSAESLIDRPKFKPNARVPPLPVHGHALSQKAVPPASNLKRFNSLENLALTQPAEPESFHDSTNDTGDEDDGSNDEAPQNAMKAPMSRSRGCNESFRAAVDRSYDISDRPSMDTRLHDNTRKELVLEVEEESSESGSFGVSGPTNSARSSVSSETPSEDANKKGGKRKPREKKGGIFKGIFRLHRSKKSSEDVSSKSQADSRLEEEAERDMIIREERALKAAQEQERLQEQHRRLHGDMSYPGEPMRHVFQPSYHPLDIDSAQPQPVHQYHDDQSHHFTRGGGGSGRDQREEKPAHMTRAEWIQHLRAEHQRKHRERQGHYPLDDREELYERQIQEAERSKYDKSAIIDSYIPHNPGSRPASRQQYEPPPPHPHNYVDYYQSAPTPHHYNYHSVPSMPHSQDYSHIRQNSDSYMDQTRDFYSHRPQMRSRTPVEQYQGDHFSYQRKPYHGQELHSSGGYYGDQVFTYRDPTYPSVAGKRPVPTLTQPGSAKV